MKVNVDRSRCAALGMCEEVAPAYFEVDDSGDVQVLRAEVNPDDLELIKIAITKCPQSALSLTD